MTADNRLRPPLDATFDGLPPSWAPIVEAWRCSAPGQALVDFLEGRLAAGACVFPADPLRALRLTPLEQTRVVVLGQDPYHGAGQAEGLAFSVPPGMAPPPSLRNIFVELQRSLGTQPLSGHLGAWAARGVLLLNRVLTVEEAAPGSHANRGWEALTSDILVATAKHGESKVYLLWGASARALAPQVVQGGRHLVLEANHPSPLSARRDPLPFVGCDHFRLAQAFLREARGEAFDWSLP